MLLGVILECLGQYLQFTVLRGGKKKHVLAFQKTNWANVRVFFLEIEREFQMLVGKPLNLFEMLGECKELNQTLPV